MSKNKAVTPIDEQLLTPAAPAETVAKAEPDRAAEAVAQLQKLIATFDPETQHKLAQLGTVLPGGDVASAIAGKFTWGIRCARCNDIALYFVGTKFIDLNNNAEYDEPQPHMKIHQLPWTQNLPADQIDRRDPRCQCCGAFVEKEGPECFRFTRQRLVRVDEFRASRDDSYDKKKLRALKRAVDAMADMASRADGKTDVIKDSINRASLESISKLLERTNPAALREMEAVDAQLMAAGKGGLLGMLASEG